jgi:hypothetical protein
MNSLDSNHDCSEDGCAHHDSNQLQIVCWGTCACPHTSMHACIHTCTDVRVMVTMHHFYDFNIRAGSEIRKENGGLRQRSCHIYHMMASCNRSRAWEEETHHTDVNVVALFWMCCSRARADASSKQQRADASSKQQRDDAESLLLVAGVAAARICTTRPDDHGFWTAPRAWVTAAPEHTRLWHIVQAFSNQCDSSQSYCIFMFKISGAT